MLDIDPEKATKKLEGIDALLEGIKKILKKHWGILLLLLFGYGVYAMIQDIANDPDPVETEIATPAHDVNTTEPYIIKESFIIDQQYRPGDTVYVDVYSDGYTERYYISDDADYPPND